MDVFIFILSCIIGLAVWLGLYAIVSMTEMYVWTDILLAFVLIFGWIPAGLAAIFSAEGLYWLINHIPFLS